MSVDPRRPGTVLIQPESGGRLSGGYLYNQRMAGEGAWALVEAAPERLGSVVSGCRKRLIVADSIWLTEQHIEPFLRARAQGARVGCLLHSFPSMIEAAESGREPLTEPSSFEVEALQRLGLALVVGPHYARLLEGSGVDVRVCSPGIEEGVRGRPERRADGPCRFVSLAALSPRKGLLDALEALSRLPPGASYRWTIAGSSEVDPAYARDLVARAKGLPIRLLGQLPPAQVQQLLRESDVLLMPSYDENHPLVLLEAMAACVPSVAYAAGAARQMLEPPERGLVVPIGDRRGFSQAVGQLLASEEQRLAMARRCLKYRSDLPGWEEAARRCRAVLADLSGWAAG